MFLNPSLLSPCLHDLARLANTRNMASIRGIITLYRNSDVIDRFRSRILFKEDMQSLNVFKRHLDSFLGLKEKAKEVGISAYEIKLFRLARIKTEGGEKTENYAIYTQDQWDMERPLLLGSSGSELNGGYPYLTYLIIFDHKHYLSFSKFGLFEFSIL